jgi:hypothetical protein
MLTPLDGDKTSSKTGSSFGQLGSHFSFFKLGTRTWGWFERVRSENPRKDKLTSITAAQAMKVAGLQLTLAMELRKSLDGMQSHLCPQF